MEKYLRHAPQLLFAFALISLGVFSTGCTYLIEATGKRAATGKLSREFDLRVQRVPAFMGCLETPGGSCPGLDTGDVEIDFFSTIRFAGDLTPLDTSTATPNLDLLDVDASPAQVATSTIAELAREVLNHDVQKQLNALFDVARGVAPEDTPASDLLDYSSAPDGTTSVSFDFDLASFEDYERDIEAATLLGAWDALEREADLLDTSDESAHRARFIKSYFQAYFRQGRFFKATLDASELKSRLIAKTKELLPGLPSDEDYEALASRVFSHFKVNAETGYVFGAIQDEGFVTRGGQSVSFPAVELASTLGRSQVAVTDIDYIVVGSDLIRVLLHAIYDAKMQLPAVSNATGVGVTPTGLVVNDGDMVGESEFERVETLAGQVEGVVAAGTGRLLRGVSFFSLNNEALASAIETAVGVAIRKQAEKAAWCWYACGFNDMHPDAGDYTVLGHGDQIKLTISVAGIPELAVGGEARPR